MIHGAMSQLTRRCFFKDSVEYYFNMVKDHPLKKTPTNIVRTSFRLIRWRSPCSAHWDETHHHHPQVASILSSFFPYLTTSQSSYPSCRKSGGQKHYWRSSEPNRSQARAAVNASQTFLRPNWIEADSLFLAWGLTEGKALVLYGTVKHLCVRLLVVNKLLLPGSLLEMKTHSLKFSKDIEIPVKQCHSQGARGRILRGRNRSCRLQRPPLLLAASLLHLFWTLLSWPCGNLLLLLLCWQMHFISTTSVLQWDSSPSPLHEPEMFARAAGSRSVAMETWKPKADFASPLRGSPIRIQHPYFLRRNLL